MFNVGGAEMLVIMLVALIVLGPNKLPDAARQAGKWMGEFRKISTGFQREMRDAMHEMSSPLDLGPGSTAGSGPTVTSGPGTNGTGTNGASRPSLEKSSDAAAPSGDPGPSTTKDASPGPGDAA